MEKLLVEAVYNTNDNEYYTVNGSSRIVNNDGICTDEIIYGSKIFFLENQINVEKSNKTIKKSLTRRTRITLSDYLNLGDIVCINNKKYICLYFDRTRTILSERSDGEVTVDNIFQVPSQSLYLKAGQANLEELSRIRSFIGRFRGLFREMHVKTIERELDLILTK